jgi:hydroxymethylbilane synthase
MLPAPGQGALAVQCRVYDEKTLAILSTLEDDATRKAVTAERAFLQGLGGGCSVPVAAFAEVDGQSINLTGLVISEDGRKAIHVNRTGADANLLGAELADRAIAQGANEILAMDVMA